MAKAPPSRPRRRRPFLAQIHAIGELAPNGLSTKYQDDFYDGFIINHMQHYLRPEEYAEAIGVINAVLPAAWPRSSSAALCCFRRWRCCLPRAVLAAERRLQLALEQVNALPHMQERQLQWRLWRSDMAYPSPPWRCHGELTSWIEISKHPDAPFPVLYPRSPSQRKATPARGHEAKEKKVEDAELETLQEQEQQGPMETVC
ncbi:hypothetical protein ATCC90586_007815 [Pythium insidiosum]|nr:hypothetical protein ATCC90586_007815 [Pythium insidiosum]